MGIIRGKGKSIEELRNEAKMLREKQKAKSKMLQEDQEKVKLRKEIRGYKYPKTLKTAKSFKKYGGTAVKGAGRALGRLGSGAANIVERELNIKQPTIKKKSMGTARRRRRKK